MNREGGGELLKVSGSFSKACTAARLLLHQCCRTTGIDALRRIELNSRLETVTRHTHASSKLLTSDQLRQVHRVFDWLETRLIDLGIVSRWFH